MNWGLKPTNFTGDWGNFAASGHTRFLGRTASDAMTASGGLAEHGRGVDGLSERRASRLDFREVIRTLTGKSTAHEALHWTPLCAHVCTRSVSSGVHDVALASSFKAVSDTDPPILTLLSRHSSRNLCVLRCSRRSGRPVWGPESPFFLA